MFDGRHCMMTRMAPSPDAIEVGESGDRTNLVIARQWEFIVPGREPKNAFCDQSAAVSLHEQAIPKHQRYEGARDEAFLTTMNNRSSVPRS